MELRSAPPENPFQACYKCPNSGAYCGAYRATSPLPLLLLLHKLQMQLLEWLAGTELARHGFQLSGGPALGCILLHLSSSMMAITKPPAERTMDARKKKSSLFRSAIV